MNGLLRDIFNYSSFSYGKNILFDLDLEWTRPERGVVFIFLHLQSEHLLTQTNRKSMEKLPFSRSASA